MQNILKKRVVTLVLCLTFAFPVAWAQESPDISVQEVASGLYMLSGKGGNLGVMTGADGTFLVDDQFAPATPAILEAIRSVGGSRPRFLLNTHFHNDHTGGNENFGSADALIMAHDSVRRYLADGYEIKVFAKQVPPAPPAALPVVTYQEGLTLHINGDHVRAIHVANAHTDGDTFIHFQSANVIHAGDIFFNGFFPFIDTAHGGRLKGMITAVNRILEVADAQTKIIPGHGPLGDRAALLRYREMLETAYQRLSALKGQGLTLEQVLARKPLADLDADWGQVMFAAEAWIPLVFDTL